MGASAVRDAPVRYVAVDATNFESQGSFDIAVYTDDLLFFLAYDPSVDHITTTAVTRSGIESIEVLSAPNFVTGDIPGTHLGTLSALTTYGTIKVGLPGDDYASEYDRAGLHEFMVSLYRDLARRSEHPRPRVACPCESSSKLRDLPRLGSTHGNDRSRISHGLRQLPPWTRDRERRDRHSSWR